MNRGYAQTATAGLHGETILVHWGAMVLELSYRHWVRDDALRANEDPDRRHGDNLQPDIGAFDRQPRLRCSCGRWEWDAKDQVWVSGKARLKQKSVECPACRTWMSVFLDETLPD